MPHALIVEDDLSYQLAFAEVVRREGFTIATAPNLKDAREELERNPPDVLFVDLGLPDGSGIELLEDIDGHPETVLITGQASVETAVAALRRGASDYLTKPVDVARVKMVLANVARTRRLKREIGSLRGELRKLGHFGLLVGASSAMQKVYDLIGKVAKTQATILITGETGTGKEVAAQTVHQLSRRSSSAFLPLNCGAVAPNLIESELFGHDRGAFTGADRVHKGYFERASGGTLFLDEVTETPLELQVKLLRVLETSTVTHVGGSDAIKVDVRVIAATNRSPLEAVRAGKLREDLLYRLNVFPIHLPTLAERQEDVELLAESFLGALNRQEGTSKKLTHAALQLLRTQHWPGNVRELRNVVQRAFILAEGEEIGIDVLPLDTPSETDGASASSEVGTSVAEAERRLILATLEHFHGDKRKAADVLKISLKTLYNRINQYKIGPA